MKITNASKRVAGAALTWWLSRRPVGWSRAQHIACPAVNCASDEERALAHTCVALVEALALGDVQ